MQQPIGKVVLDVQAGLILKNYLLNDIGYLEFEPDAIKVARPVLTNRGT